MNCKLDLGWLSALGLINFAVCRTSYFPGQNRLYGNVQISSNNEAKHPRLFMKCCLHVSICVCQASLQLVMHFGQQGLPIESARLAWLRLVRFHVCTG